MKRCALTLTCALGLATGNALAWSNHTYAAYRVFEKMPEVAAAAPVTVEPLEAFLKTQEQSIEALLTQQEVWAKRIQKYQENLVIARRSPLRSQ